MDFVALNHGSYLADKETMIDILGYYIEEAGDTAFDSLNSPRILFTGSTLARGDTKLMDIIGKSGGTIAVEEFAEGLRPWQDTIKLEGDMLSNLAETYFMERVCAGWFRTGYRTA